MEKLRHFEVALQIGVSGCKTYKRGKEKLEIGATTEEEKSISKIILKRAITRVCRIFPTELFRLHRKFYFDSSHEERKNYEFNHESCVGYFRLFSFFEDLNFSFFRHSTKYDFSFALFDSYLDEKICARVVDFVGVERNFCVDCRLWRWIITLFAFATNFQHSKTLFFFLTEILNETRIIIYSVQVLLSCQHHSPVTAPSFS